VLGGWNVLQDYESELAGNELLGSFDDGWLVGVAGGRRVRSNLRSELEFALRTNTGLSGSIGGVGSYLSGHAYTWTAMSNIYYDYHNCKSRGITPYAGLGIGLALIDGHFSTSLTDLSVENAAFAFQTMIGASKSVGRNAELFGEYRYLGTTDITLKTVGNAPPVSVDDENLNNHAAVFGIRVFK
jgi:opacity protein-like surface antigen